MKRTPNRLILALAASIFAGPSVLAQSPAASPSAASDASMADQKTAFLAFPEETRRAAQDALVWLGFYNGAVDGDFGKRTRDAILAFQASVQAPASGAMSAGTLQALLAAAQVARKEVGFQVIDDARTGARIGAPAKLLSGVNIPAKGVGGGVKLDFASSADTDLNALYARLIAETATRKIAYKTIKADTFFVISGQDGAVKFYTRFEKNEAATPPVRGFTFAYPASQSARLDRIAIAVANSFEAFPAHAAEPVKATATSAVTRASDSDVRASPPGPALTATALVVGPGRALTALQADGCVDASVDDKPIRFERADAATGLTIIAGDFGSKGEAPSLGALTSDLVVLTFAGRRVAASSATLAGDDARPLVMAAIEKSGGGGPVFDRAGALVGILEPIAEGPKRVAGVALAAPHPIVGPDALRAFLGVGETAPAAAARLSAGDISAREMGALLAVYCRR